MQVTFDEKLTSRTIAFCKDELNYHINESGCANQYHDETIAELELLYRLGEENLAENYKNQYIDVLSRMIDNKRDSRLRKELEDLKNELRAF